jgi:hypothetical protein
LKRWWLAALMPLMLSACGDEGPTEIGAGLLPANAIRTFEIVIGPERYLVFDTAFGLYSEPQDAPFLILANQFENALDARGLARFNIPTAITVVDTAGAVRLDTMPRFFAGTVRMAVDTLHEGSPPARLALYRTAEEWEVSATWTLRSDEGGVQRAWTTPGGTRGILVDTMTFVPGVDSLRFRVDSATIAIWSDTTNAARGALFVVESGGVRLRTTLPMLHLQARSSFRPDTVFTTLASAPTQTFIFTPEQPTVAGQPRVGGTPAWRTVLRLQDRLDTLSFACPGVPNCRFRLGEADLNHAGLRLEPVPSPPGFRPEGTLSLGAYLLLPSPQIPLPRSPLGSLFSFTTVPATSFQTVGAPAVDIMVTELIRTLMRDPASRATDFAPTHVALVSGEPRNFGFGTFAPLPSLRLVVSIAQELQLP